MFVFEFIFSISSVELFNKMNLLNSLLLLLLIFDNKSLLSKYLFKISKIKINLFVFKKWIKKLKIILGTKIWILLFKYLLIKGMFLFKGDFNIKNSSISFWKIKKFFSKYFKNSFASFHFSVKINSKNK